MSYIVPTEKPNCFYCNFRDMDDCKLTCVCVTLYANTLSTSPSCPLIAMPVNTRGLVSVKDVQQAFDDAIINEQKRTGKLRATYDEVAKVISTIPIFFPDDNEVMK